MHVLQIEHPIRDFETWKGAFDRFSGKRQQSGVRRHQVLRPTDAELRRYRARVRRTQRGGVLPRPASARGVVLSGSGTGPDGRAADADRRGGGSQGVLTPAFSRSLVHRSAWKGCSQKCATHSRHPSNSIDSSFGGYYRADVT